MMGKKHGSIAKAGKVRYRGQKGPNPKPVRIPEPTKVRKKLFPRLRLRKLYLKIGGEEGERAHTESEEDIEREESTDI